MNSKSTVLRTALFERPSRVLIIPATIAMLTLAACGGGNDSVTANNTPADLSDTGVLPEVTGAGDISAALGVEPWGDTYCADVEPLNDGRGVAFNYVTRQLEGSDGCDIPVIAAAPDSFLLADAEEQRLSGAVAIDGRRLVVGGGYTVAFDSAANSTIVDHFPLRVFELSDSDEWVLTDLLQEDGNNSGYAFDISGNRVVVSNRQANEAFVYEKVANDSWTTSRFTAGEDLPQMTFGTTAAIDNDRVVIGAAFNGSFPNQTQHETGNEALYVYDRSAKGEWLLTARIVPSDFSPDIESGFAQNGLDLDGDRIVAVADFSVARCNTGNCSITDFPRNVYLFEKNSDGEWIESILNPADTESTAGFSSVTIEDNLIAVGVPSGGPDQVNSGTGAVLLFRQNADGIWQENQLIPSDATGGYLFGDSVQLEDDLLLVSSPGEPEIGRLHSSVYLYSIASDGVQSETILSYLNPNAEIGSFAYSDQRLVVPELTLWVREGPGAIITRGIDY